MPAGLAQSATAQKVIYTMTKNHFADAAPDTRARTHSRATGLADWVRTNGGSARFTFVPDFWPNVPIAYFGP
jgi:hypothetical protein